MRISSVGEVLVAIHAAKRIGAPARTPGVCQCSPPCISGIPIFPNSQSKETKMVLLSEIDKAICARIGVAEEQFAARKAEREVTVAAPAAKIRAGFVSINSSDGDGSDDGSSLTACCRGDATMSHLEGHRDAINSEINRRSGTAHAVRFVR